MIRFGRLPLGDDGMVANPVNLDALIPREDMASTGESLGSRLDKIDIHHLDSHFFVSTLRKPDFQRETAQWTPDKVADLVRAFVEGDLIPAVILWQRGPNVFVIDGAHRLSALIAWVTNDYGDGVKSREYLGGSVSDEQRRIAERTRQMVNKLVEPYSEFHMAMTKPGSITPEMVARLGNLGVNSIVAQWVPGVDQQAAEDSFFKINQAATPIDKTERTILKHRRSPNAIAARAIVRGGEGHKYWEHYVETSQAEIELLAKKLHNTMYEPPIGPSPIKTIDLPLAGRGYSALPFVFELVNWANGIPEMTGKKTEIAPSPDEDGAETIKCMKAVRDHLSLITGPHPESLGLHPVVYFYTRGGDFQPIPFIATLSFVSELAKAGRRNEFTKHRRQFEDFLVAHKEFATLVVKATGSGRRSLPRIRRLFGFILDRIGEGMPNDQVLEALEKDSELSFLAARARIPPIRDGENPTRRFNRATKSASFLNSAVQSAVRCGICGAMVHRNSMQIDHIDRARDDGGTSMGNAQVSHPYCNSTYKG